MIQALQVALFVGLLLVGCAHHPAPRFVCLEDSKNNTCVCLSPDDAIALLRRQNGYVIYGPDGQRMIVLENWQAVRSCEP